jgi:hypothetical protein
MEVLNPSGIVVAELLCGKFNERPAETKGCAGVWVRLAEIKAEMNVSHGIVSAKRATASANSVLIG